MRSNLGCKVNQSEMEGAARRLRERGVPLVDARPRADLVLVNTCTVTAEADAKSRARRPARPARQPATPRSSSPAARSRSGREAFARRRPAARLVDNRRRTRSSPSSTVLLGEPTADADDGPRRRAADALGRRPGRSRRSTASPTTARSVERTRAFVKVQDGCSFFCTYCIIPAARGPERIALARRPSSPTSAGRSPPVIARSS